MRTRTSRTELVAAGLALGAATLMPLGAIGWLASLVVVCAMIVLVAAMPLQRVHAVAESARDRWARRNARMRALPFGSPEAIMLNELTYLADQVEREDAQLAKRLDLEALLDRHVSVAIAHRRAVRAARMSDGDQLVRLRDELRANPAADARRLELCERQLGSHDQCAARVARLADELSVIEQLIRLAAQRAVCPEMPPQDDFVERHLCELDAADDAQRVLGEGSP